MPERAKFYAAQLRWANGRSGLEFSPLTAETGFDARRHPRQRPGTAPTVWATETTEFGLLTQDELERDGYGEGCGVIVIALPRRLLDQEIIAARDRIAAALAQDAEANGG